eukprot:5406881-Prymnesium_polylepis.1
MTAAATARRHVNRRNVRRTRRRRRVVRRMRPIAMRVMSHPRSVGRTSMRRVTSPRATVVAMAVAHPRRRRRRAAGWSHD